MEMMLQKHKSTVYSRRLGYSNRCLCKMRGKHKFLLIKFFSFAVVVIAGFFLTEFNVRQTLKKSTQVDESIAVTSSSDGVGKKMHLRRPDYINITRKEPNSDSVQVDEQMNGTSNFHFLSCNSHFDAPNLV